MASPIKIKRSAVAGKVPTTTDLELGELGLNTHDGKLYAKKDDGSESIVELSGGGSSAGVSSIIAGAGIAVDQSTGDVTITNTGGGGDGTTTADIYGTAKAWGYVNSSGILNEGFNVSTIRNSTGSYTVTFDTPFNNNNYTVVVSGASSSQLTIRILGNQTTAEFEVRSQDVSGTFVDSGFGFTVYDNEPAEIIVGSGTVANTNLYGTAKAWGSVNAVGTLRQGFNCTSTSPQQGQYQ